MKFYLFWITGLSGVGKTTLANLLKKRFEELSIPSISIDGDIIREVFGDNRKYDRESRLQTAYKYSKLCSYLVKQNTHIICSTISLFNEIQQWNRSNIKNYYEILIKRDLKQIIEEDNKCIYKKVLKQEVHNVVGIDIKAEYPLYPEMIINNASKDELQQYIEKIIKSIE